MSDILSNNIQNSIREEWLKVVIEAKLADVDAHVVITISKHDNTYHLSIECKELNLILCSINKSLADTYKVVNTICGKLDNHLNITIYDEL